MADRLIPSLIEGPFDLNPPILTSEIPAPPGDKSGWPWEVGKSDSQTVREDRDDWPAITIITPSFNQGGFIEETIRSVLLQGYPNLEYIIIDGGSSDDTVDIIRKYEPWLTHWVSENDSGQTNAINKGLLRSTGQILAWLNSDDFYQSNLLFSVAEKFSGDGNTDWLATVTTEISPQKALIKRVEPQFTSLLHFLASRDYLFHQPGIFWRKRIMDTVGLLDEQFHFVMDRDYWIRFIRAGFLPRCTRIDGAFAYQHPDTKTMSEQHVACEEHWALADKHREAVNDKEWKQILTWSRKSHANSLIDNAYALLSQGKRWTTLGYLLARCSSLVYMRDKRAYFAALYHSLITGRPPPWFRNY
ncbi:MAG: glycosyltransferase family 2 protein [Verrucomicrobiia bacterium]|jgi:glycosyltransferase involved in cell wall biosynthesis